MDYNNNFREKFKEIISNQSNPNSVAAMLSGNSEEYSGVGRVFRKSIIGAVFFLVSLIFLIIISINWFNFSIFLNIIGLIFFVSITNIFFIIVADRSYIWLSIFLQFLTLIFSFSLLGQGFSNITLFLSFLSSLLTFLAYIELEKNQLSSRLFSISQITAESSRILLTVVILITVLGIFNSILSEGKNGDRYSSIPFIQRVFLKNKFIMDNIIIGNNKTLSLNRFVMGGKLYKDSGSNKILYDVSTKNGIIAKQATFEVFLEFNYKSNFVLTDKEIDDIQLSSCEGDVTTSDCQQKITTEKRRKLEEFKNERYSSLEYELDTPLTVENLSKIAIEYYSFRINDLENPQDKENSPIPENLLIIPLNQIIIALISISILILLFIFKFLLGFLSFISTWIIWKILILTGLVQIDIETVEAEIVSI